jgi:hypothetical protein
VGVPSIWAVGILEGEMGVGLVIEIVYRELIMKILLERVFIKSLGVRF